MLREREPMGLPVGTSVPSVISSGRRISPQREPTAVIESSNFSTKMTVGSFSIPTSPGYREAMPPPEEGAFTVRVKLVVRVRPPPVAVTVIG
jgi:hypothetical protein